MSVDAIAEGPPRCMRDGCTNDACEVCKGCGIATYCSIDHSLEHWKFHVDECNIQDPIDAKTQVPWLVEEEITDGTEGGKTAWEPVFAYHALDMESPDHPDGIASAFITSFELAEHYNKERMPDFDALIGEQETAAALEQIAAPAVRTTVRSGATRLKGVPCGVTPQDIPASISITVGPQNLQVAGGVTVAPINVTYHFPAKQFSKHLCLRRSGLSFKLPASFLDSRTHMRNMEGVLTAFPEGGSLTVKITYGNKVWSVSGFYSIPQMLNKPSDQSFRARTRATVHQLGHFGRKTLTGTSVYRIKAKTAENVTAVLFLHRGVSSHRGGTPLYNLRQIEVHVPQEAINSPEQSAGIMEGKPLIMPPGMETAGDPEYDVEKNGAQIIDSEFRPDVMALYDCIQDERDEMRATYDEAQSNMDVKAEDRDKIHRQLTEISRLCSLIGDHVNTLEKEERGDIDAENISHDTQQAIDDAIAYIEENVFTRTSRRGARAFRDWRAIRKHRREIKKMSPEDLLRMFISKVNIWEDSLSTNTEDTRTREEARAEQEAIKSDSRFRDLLSRQEFRDANKKFMDLVHQGASVRQRKLAQRKEHAQGGGGSGDTGGGN